MDLGNKIPNFDTSNSSPSTPPSKVAVPWGRPSPQASAAIYRAIVRYTPIRIKVTPRQLRGICNRYVYYSASRAEDSLMAALWSHYRGLVAVRGRSGYILGSTLRLRYSSQYEMRGQISQSGGNSGAIAATAGPSNKKQQAPRPGPSMSSSYSAYGTLALA